jgi:DNA repair protein RecO (recombination protein O)
MRLHSKTFNAVGIILKRSNVGETDRIVSLLTQEHGKLVAIAKGVRKMSSSRRADLEPGNYLKAHFVNTKSMPILTQTKLLEDCADIRNSLADIRKLTQFLEIVEKLFVEEELEPQVFEYVVNLRQKIVSGELSNGHVKHALSNLIEQLGYQPYAETDHHSILDYVSVLSDKPMRSFEYLSVKK